MKLINGKEIAVKKFATVKEVVDQLNVEPNLAVILIGDDPASHLYVKLKEKAAKEVGVELHKYTFDKDISKNEIKSAIEFLNNDGDIHGIIVQLPLPKHLDTDEIVNLVSPDKDVDGFHKINQEKFLNNKDCIYPVFPNAIMSLIDSEVESVKDKKVVVVGKSDVFDKIMTHAFDVEGAQTNFIQCVEERVFNQREQDTINSADIIVTACGLSKMLSCDLISDGTVVVDGGISKVDNKVVGDVDITSCKDREITISAVPGGVGPVTIACLLDNVIEITKKQC